MGRAFEVRKNAMAKTAGAKNKVYSRYGKEIYVCAKNGGTDPEANLSLRRLIEKAKKDQVPGHVIDKAIDKAVGGAGEDFVPMRYEGFGPGNCMVIVDCLSDNANRTITDVRNCFTKTKSNLGAQNSASHMFDHQAIFQFEGSDEDAILEVLMEADVDVTDVEGDDNKITVFAPHTEFYQVKTALTDAYPKLTFETEEITFVPQTQVDISNDDMPMFEKFMAMLEDCDDVQDVYHNANLQG
jgi:YebC/PmpR family DNA-binding regulatory protein